jgi:osmotically-inducible protein OsmY
MPPDTKPSDRQRMSTSEVESQIQDKLKSEPILAGADVGAKVDARTVTLTGTVSTEEQHDVALRIAQSYAGERKLVDKLQVQSKT